MDANDIVFLVRKVFPPGMVKEVGDEWVSVSCPLSRWTHSKGADKNPSAGISIHPSGTSIFHCWGCSSTGSLTWLISSYARFSGKDLSSFAEEAEECEEFGGSLAEWGTRDAGEEHSIPVLNEREYFLAYPSAEGHRYTTKRGMPKGAADRLRLRVDPSDSRGAERILFPVYGKNGDFYGFSGRAVSDRVVPKVRDYYGLPKDRVLLGHHLIEPCHESIIVVEGLFDWAKLAYYGLPAVASLHAGITDRQRFLLLEMDRPIILMFDNDQAGCIATDKAYQKLKGYVPVFSCSYPERGNGVMPKDPASCNRSEIMDMVNSAE